MREDHQIRRSGPSALTQRHRVSEVIALWASVSSTKVFKAPTLDTGEAFSHTFKNAGAPDPKHLDSAGGNRVMFMHDHPLAAHLA
jgi:hypothetical protein